MYGSPYGSYSGMSAPMDITPSHPYSRPQDACCAFPSWPQRASLSSQSETDSIYERATSYLSDEDLFPSDLESDYHSDARSVSSANSSSSSTPLQHQPQPQGETYRPAAISQADVLGMQREKAAYQREVMRFLALEKERRRSQAARKSSSNSGKPRSGSSSSSKKKSKLAAMTPIAEAE